jgi:AcrR family transcriptional regulator
MTLTESQPTSATSRRLTGAQRRSQLLSVAAALFAERGFSSTTMDDVAEAAGVTKPLLYQHFDSKKALYLELVDEIAQRILAAIAKATRKAEGPRSQVEDGLSAYFRLVVADPASFQLLYDRDHGGDEELGRAVRRVERALVDAVDPLIDAGLDPEHRLFLAAGLVGMAEGATVAWIDLRVELDDPEQRALEAERLARRMSAMLWAGLRSVRAD